MIKWKNARLGKFNLKLVIITLSWDKVERAIIFFMSASASAEVPAINIVNEAKINKIKE